jgi:hypothetical protein
VRVYDSTSSYMDLESDKSPFCDNSWKRSICNEFDINRRLGILPALQKVSPEWMVTHQSYLERVPTR